MAEVGNIDGDGVVDLVVGALVVAPDSRRPAHCMFLSGDARDWAKAGSTDDNDSRRQFQGHFWSCSSLARKQDSCAYLHFFW